MQRDLDWKQGITKRAQLATRWRETLPLHQALAEKCVYIRIGSGQYRPISIHHANPCGRLLREEGGVLGGTTRIENVIDGVENALPADAYRPSNGKPEHRMQAALIHHALRNNLSLQTLFDGFDDVFDELLFVTDELSAGDIRLDLIALGGKAGHYFPVLIELKANRALTRVTEQLTGARDAMQLVASSFTDLLAHVTGTPASAIALDKTRLLIIWPDSPSGAEKDTVASARDKGYLTALYQTDGRVVRARGD